MDGASLGIAAPSTRLLTYRAGFPGVKPPSHG